MGISYSIGTSSDSQSLPDDEEFETHSRNRPLERLKSHLRRGRYLMLRTLAHGGSGTHIATLSV